MPWRHSAFPLCNILASRFCDATAPLLSAKHRKQKPARGCFRKENICPH
ncbi:hypothetical protein LG3211_1627 [Lysobacter gummosus]|nr:hypothetical protein LG3211_1627 [Lysobacter gummosus]